MPKQTVDLRGGENRQAEHLKRNPHGQMPTLELDDGSYLSEITAICEYLEEKNPKPPMIGSAPRKSAPSAGCGPGASISTSASRSPTAIASA
jgi:glutathione S-transferase